MMKKLLLLIISIFALSCSDSVKKDFAAWEDTWRNYIADRDTILADSCIRFEVVPNADFTSTDTIIRLHDQVAHHCKIDNGEAKIIFDGRIIIFLIK